MLFLFYYWLFIWNTGKFLAWFCIFLLVFVILLFIYTKNQQVFENYFLQSCTKGVFPFIRPTSTFSIKTHFTISHRSLLYLFFTYILCNIYINIYTHLCIFLFPIYFTEGSMLYVFFHMLQEEGFLGALETRILDSLHWFNPCLFQRTYWVISLPTTCWVHSALQSRYRLSLSRTLSSVPCPPL